LSSLTFTDTQNKKLNKLGIKTELDLLLHFPSRYTDETKIIFINEIVPGEVCQFQGDVVSSEVSYSPRKNLVVYIRDQTGEIRIRFLNFYPSQIKQFEEGKNVRVIGEAKNSSMFYEMIHPQYKFVDRDSPLPEFYTPIYPVTSGMTQKFLYKLIQKNIENCKKNNLYAELFISLYQKKTFPSFIEAIDNIHAPPLKYEKNIFDNKETIFHKRLIYDELLAQQLFFKRKIVEMKKRKAPKFLEAKEQINVFLNNLNFTLTDEQKKVLLEIKDDFVLGHPMNRLLQGDVGSGKTVVAVIATIQAIKSGYQVAFMAPTEILAAQHYEKIKDWLLCLNINVELLTGSIKKKSKLKIYQKIENGESQLVIGTHALFQESVKFHNLGFYIIDEQHRFGVEQRISLRKKNSEQKAYEAHQLMMSATPIPRTLSMSYFADMRISTINELPPGRKKILTKVFSELKRKEILSTIKKKCLEGDQVYWVCPLIEESEVLQLETAEKTFRDLSDYFVELNVGLIHGRMSSKEKMSIMENFKNNNVQILVATTVIEVGVDVTNATLMIIENSERMGLSQLHQLRGRIGRGEKESVCILLYQNNLSDIAKKRIKIIYESIDGFKIAEEDLKLRGPGEFLGLRQSGLPTLRIADLNKDEDLLNQAKEDAEILLNEEKNISLHIDRWLRDYESLSRA